MDLDLGNIDVLPDLTIHPNIHRLRFRCNNEYNVPKLPDTVMYLELNEGKAKTMDSIPDMLATLNCSGNELTCLPDISESKLRKLSCHRNKLTTLPDLPDSLITLNCSSNKLTAVPKLPRLLKSLYCSDNKISDLGELPEMLDILHFSNNNVTSINFLPKSLSTLDMSYNPMNKLPDQLKDSNIFRLNFSYIGLTELSDDDLPSEVTELVCDSNNLTRLPKFKQRLLELNCSNNPISSLPELPESLLELHCLYNKLTEITSFPKEIQHVDCSNSLMLQENRCNHLPRINYGFFNNETKVLDINRNSITRLCNLPLRLKTLICSNNQLTELPELPESLRMLDCEGNMLTTFPKLPRELKRLFAGHNRLLTLPELPPTLYELCVIGNKYLYIPYKTSQLFLDMPDTPNYGRTVMVIQRFYRRQRWKRKLKNILMVEMALRTGNDL